MPFTYVIQSLKNGQLYIGACNNLQERILRHNQNRSKATKGKGPWKLIWARHAQNKAQAMKRRKPTLYFLFLIKGQIK